jgi:hypothetical protein
MSDIINRKFIVQWDIDWFIKCSYGCRLENEWVKQDIK